MVLIFIKNFKIKSAALLAVLFFWANVDAQNNNAALFKANNFYNNQQYAALEKYIATLKLKKQDSKLDLAFFKAVVNFQNSNYKKAVNQFLGLFFQDKNTFDAQYFNKNDTRVYIGLCYSELAQYDSCLFYLNAMEREGLPVLAHLAIAKSLFNLAKHEDALIKYSGILAMDTSLVEVYSNMGFIYHNQKEYSKAIEKFDAAIALSASIGDLYFARALSKIALKDYTACDDLKQAQQLNVEKASMLLQQLCSR